MDSLPHNSSGPVPQSHPSERLKRRDCGLQALGEGDVARLQAALGGAALLAPSQEAGEVAVV